MDADELRRFADVEQGRLLRFAYFVTGWSEDAQDLVQRAFVRMLATRGSAGPVGTIQSNGALLWAARPNNKAIVVSSDQGKTWTRVSPQ